MKPLANIVSYLFHPLFMIGYVLLLLLFLNPYLFSLNNDNAKGILILTVFILTVFFPLFGVFMMKKLDFIKSIKMEDRHDRIAPLIITGTFYLWLFVNIKGNSTIPPAFSFFVLGATIGLFLSLLLNSFTKVSLHTVGMGGLLAGAFFIRYFYTYDKVFLNLPFASYQFNTNIVLILIILAAGAVGTSRLILQAHKPMDVYGGYIVGIFAQIIAFRIIV